MRRRERWEGLPLASQGHQADGLGVVAGLVSEVGGERGRGLVARAGAAPATLELLSEARARLALVVRYWGGTEVVEGAAAAEGAGGFERPGIHPAGSS